MVRYDRPIRSMLLRSLSHRFKKQWVLRYFMVVIFFLFYFPGFAQTDQYVIKFKDKANSPYRISDPGVFLSQRAIERRIRQNIAIVENDLPVNPVYIDSIRKAGVVKILNTSKWLNQVLIETSDEDALEKINTFPFVQGRDQVRRTLNHNPLPRKFQDTILDNISQKKSGFAGDLDYGDAADQIRIHKGDFLHQKGFTGSGILIAVIDAGFFHYRSLPAFDSLRLQNRIIDTWDFVDQKPDMNEDDAHGMQCLSIMAANVPGQMVGSAPAAFYLLYRSENVFAEYPAEEQNWIAAAERSDSAGADIITTSLGYNTFDNPAFDYTYEDMDGRTTMMAVAAQIAASKGMILLVSAGNEGNKPWHYITTPADANHVLTVGAVDVTGKPGSFTSFGPTSDGRGKPEVASVGVSTLIQGPTGVFSRGNGTSFATPNLAGLVACFWQAFPDFSAVEIMDAVRKSGSKYPNPDERVGYGIPDFEKGFETLAEIRLQRRYDSLLHGSQILIFPNPIRETATMIVKPQNGGDAVLNWYDAAGRLCATQRVTLVGGTANAVPLSRRGLQAGIYTLRLVIGSEKIIRRVAVF